MSPRAARAERLAPLALPLVAALALAAFPHVACAVDIGAEIDDWFKTFLTDISTGLIRWINTVIDDMVGGSDLLASFDNLFGNSGPDVYAAAVNVSNGAVKPISEAILAFCFVVQMIKASEHIDGSQTLPGVWPIAKIVVWFAVMSLLIGHADGICAALYYTARSIASDVPTSVDSSYMEISSQSLDELALDGLVMFALMMLVVLVCLVIAWMVMTFCVWGRALQIYVYLMFAPIPIALLGSESTKHIGVGYLRNFFALCLAAAVMMFCMYMFFLLFAGIMSDYSAAWKVVGGEASDLGSFTKLLAVCVLLVFSLVKSGTWAREVMGA